VEAGTAESAELGQSVQYVAEVAVHKEAEEREANEEGKDPEQEGEASDVAAVFANRAHGALALPRSDLFAVVFFAAVLFAVLFAAVLFTVVFTVVDFFGVVVFFAALGGRVRA
jgi:ABC-type Na+ efflux pump permease subunit